MGCVTIFGVIAWKAGGFILVTWMGGVSMGWGACENARAYGLLLLHLIP